MDDKIYSVTLADGTVISGLSMNGNNYISKTEISADIFDGNLSSVTISDGENEETFENMDLIHLTAYDSGEYWFALRELSEDEIERLQLRSDIEYLSMMTGVELYKERRITMAYSKNYANVKKWYNMGMWSEARVRNAVVMGWITEDEFKEITGSDYE